MYRVTIAGLLLTAFAAANADELKLTSSDIGPDKPLAQEFVYNAFGCTGGNQSYEFGR